VPLPNHGENVAGPSPDNTESTCSAIKAWHYLIRHGRDTLATAGVPCILQCFLAVTCFCALRILVNGLSPCVLLLQRVLTRKTWQALTPLRCTTTCASNTSTSTFPKHRTSTSMPWRHTTKTQRNKSQTLHYSTTYRGVAAGTPSNDMTSTLACACVCEIRSCGQELSSTCCNHTCARMHMR
jgi:hypothetical protein